MWWVIRHKPVARCSTWAFLFAWIRVAATAAGSPRSMSRRVRFGKPINGEKSAAESEYRATAELLRHAGQGRLDFRVRRSGAIVSRLLLLQIHCHTAISPHGSRSPAPWQPPSRSAADHLFHGLPEAGGEADSAADGGYDTGETRQYGCRYLIRFRVLGPQTRKLLWVQRSSGQSGVRRFEAEVVSRSVWGLTCDPSM